MLFISWQTAVVLGVDKLPTLSIKPLKGAEDARGLLSEKCKGGAKGVQELNDQTRYL